MHRLISFARRAPLHMHSFVFMPSPPIPHTLHRHHQNTIQPTPNPSPAVTFLGSVYAASPINPAAHLIFPRHSRHRHSQHSFPLLCPPRVFRTLSLPACHPANSLLSLLPAPCPRALASASAFESLIALHSYSTQQRTLGTPSSCCNPRRDVPTAELAVETPAAANQTLDQSAYSSGAVARASA